MSDCPVRIFTATNVSAEQLAAWGEECFNCGKPLSGHPIEQRRNVQPGMAYAVNPEALARYP